MNNLSIDEHFNLLLYKKIMNKTGSAKRRAKKYYKDHYKKTGIIPALLMLAEKGIMEGRKCSGRPRSIDEQTKRRFIEMVKASCDLSSQGFVFITRKARTIKNYHCWLEEEMGKPISLPGLRLCAKRENLKFYLEKENYEEEPAPPHAFKSEPVFNLIQMDGCKFRYLKIKDNNGKWQKPQVIEAFDTGSRYMFFLRAYFTESSLNSVDLFTRFLLRTPFPQQKIKFRPDQAGGFLNLNVFEIKEDGILLGEALARKPFEKPHEPETKMLPDELDMIIALLEEHNMVVYRPTLIEVYHRGLTLARAKQVFHHNLPRYSVYNKKVRLPEAEKGAALFRAFILDCKRSIDSNYVATYATNGDLDFISDKRRVSYLSATYNRIYRGQSVLIEGDFGAGKTRFLQLLRPKKLHTVWVESLFNIHETLAAILRELNYDTKATYRRTPQYLKIICNLSNCFIIIDEANDLDTRVWPYLKRIIDAGVPIVLAGLPKVRTYLSHNHPDILSRLKTLILYPIVSGGVKMS